MPDWKEEGGGRYRISYNKEQTNFRILDLWEESVRNLPLEADIPDNSPAVKILSTLEVNALLGSLDQMGWLEKYREFAGGGSKITPEIIPNIRKSSHELAIEKIAEITLASTPQGASEAVAKEAILAIRELLNGFGR